VANPEGFFQDQFPVANWPIIPTILETAYSAADDLIKDSPILQIESAEDNRGRIVSWAVDLGLRRAIELGSIKCDYRWRYFAQPTGRYLELRFSHSVASVSQISVPNKQPRNVVFRENARLRSQYVFDFDDFREEQRITGLPHFLLVHGYQELNFAHFGLPSSTSKTKWAWRSRNLMNMPHEVASKEPPPENTETDFEEINLLKEDIERWRRENGEP
jgi:hypothetical protein